MGTSKTARATGVIVLTLLVAACGASSQTTSTPASVSRPAGSQPSSAPPPGPRPSSPATVRIDAPNDGQVVHGSTVTVRLALGGARVVTVTTRNIRPDRGHIHLTLDGQVVSTNYGLIQTLKAVTPGPHSLRAEFVAADHIPFNPRVFTQIAFEDQR